MSFLLNFPGNADAVRFDAGQVDHLQPVFGYPYGFEPSPSHAPMKARTLAKHHSNVIKVQKGSVTMRMKSTGLQISLPAGSRFEH